MKHTPAVWKGPQFQGVAIRVSYISERNSQFDHVDALTPDGDIVPTFRGVLLPCDIHPASITFAQRWMNRTLLREIGED